jgi:hypothetical protein
MCQITNRHGRRKSSSFDICAKRRWEIALHARLVGAADTEDFSRWLIAWIWHNPRAMDQIWSVMNAARTMGREITEAEASDLIEEASITRKHKSADNLARFLGVTYEQRQRLGLTTIGSTNVKRQARKELRKRADRLYRERRRRTKGVRPRGEYEATSTAAQARAEGVSRMTIYRRRKAAEQAKNMPHVTGPSAAIFLSTEVRPVTGLAEGGFASKEASQRLPSSQTANMPAVDIYQSLPVELRLVALGLPIPDDMQMAA